MVRRPVVEHGSISDSAEACVPRPTAPQGEIAVSVEPREAEHGGQKDHERPHPAPYSDSPIFMFTTRSLPSSISTYVSATMSPGAGMHRLEKRLATPSHSGRGSVTPGR